MSCACRGCRGDHTDGEIIGETWRKTGQSGLSSSGPPPSSSMILLLTTNKQLSPHTTSCYDDREELQYKIKQDYLL